MYFIRMSTFKLIYFKAIFSIVNKIAADSLYQGILMIG